MLVNNAALSLLAKSSFNPLLNIFRPFTEEVKCYDFFLLFEGKKHKLLGKIIYYIRIQLSRQCTL